ncbi:MAG: hypothetical protein L0191_02105 [Acidobacteria bacterium]|nr:hypothetical protein [Acidobacteriota bacterium]
MRLLCAWCEKEGKPALLAEVEPKDDPTPTHGMCPAHRAEAEKEIEALRQTLNKELGALREKVDP